MVRAGSNDELVDQVARRADRYLGGRPRTARVLAAMRAIDRALFLPSPRRPDAYFDDPVPIGRGQTCSQPSMVAFMLDMLDPRPGDRMLEIGSGSGYAAAIAALLCGPEGLVYAAEILPELAAAARISCRTCFPGSVFSAAIADRIVFIDGDGSAGFPELGPFDRILLSAGVSSRSFRTEVLLDQLAPGGALLYPERVGGIFLLRKTPDGLLRQQWNSVSFVPLLGRNS